MHRPRYTNLAQTRSTSLRSELTISEATLWKRLRRDQLGVRFRRQVPIGQWIADFACFNPKLVIEVDGSSHDFRDEMSRTEFIEAQGFRLIRFTNKEVAQNVGSVVRTIEIALDSVESE